MAKKKGRKKARKLIARKTQDRRLGRKEIKKIAKRTGRTGNQIRNQATKINKNLKPKKQFTIKPTVRSQAKNFLSRKGKDDNLSRKDLKRFDKRFGDLKKSDKILNKFLKENPNVSKGKPRGLATDLIKQAGDIDPELPDTDDSFVDQFPTGYDFVTTDQTPDMSGINEQLAQLKAFADSIDYGNIAMNDQTFVGSRNAGGVRFRRRKNRKALGMGTGQLKRSVRNQGLQMNPVNV